MNAIAVFDKNSKSSLEGSIEFHQCTKTSKTNIRINLKGFKPNKTHAIHIHEFGNLSEGCLSAGGHYNPFKKNHGNYKIHGKNRHVGDLINNITSDRNGEVHLQFEDDLVSMYSPNSIYGRSIVIHEKEDDLGLGGDKESLITGNAGSRIACIVIGVAKENHF